MKDPVKQKEKAARRRAGGVLCNLCSRPRTHGVLCERHQQVMWDRARNRGRSRLNRCSICKEPGHNKTNHPRTT